MRRALLWVLFALCPLTARATDPHAEGDGAHAHHVAAFGGATVSAHETAPSVGLDYSFHPDFMDHRIGLGALGDATFGHALEVVIGLAVAAKGPIGLQLAVGPILILVEDEKSWGGRVNLSYGYALDARWSVGPSVSADFVPHATMYVLGVNGGLGF